MKTTTRKRSTNTIHATIDISDVVRVVGWERAMKMLVFLVTNGPTSRSRRLSRSRNHPAPA